jgi:hypothetical protein
MLNFVIILYFLARERTAPAEISHYNHHGGDSWHMFQLKWSQLQLILRAELSLDSQIGSSLDTCSPSSRTSFRT